MKGADASKTSESSAAGETSFRTGIKRQAHVLPFYDILPPTAEYLLNMRQWRRNVRNFGETGVIDRNRRDDRLPRD